MILTERHKLALLMTFHGAWGLVLWFSISKYGLGISTDSVHLLFGGLNFSQGRGLTSFDGSFLLFWPPLYPVLLAFVHLISGLGPFASAHVLQAASFFGLSLCLSILFLRIFPGNFLPALAANILSDVGAVVLTTFDIVGSDYVHLFLAMLFVLLAGYYMESRSPRILLAMSAVGMLAMLQRYLGVAAIATGAAVIFFYTDGDLRRRIGRSFLMGLSALPAALWLFVTRRLVEPREPVRFADNFAWFSKSILEWVFPADRIESQSTLNMIGLWIFIGGLIVLLFFISRKHRVFTSFAIPVFVYGISYVLALFGSASLEYFNKLGGRFLLPVYIPFVTLVVTAIAALLRRTQEAGSRHRRRLIPIGLAGALVLIAGGLLKTTIPLALQAGMDGAAGENVFNTRAWHENSVMEYWLQHQPEGRYLSFSNAPDGVAFYTWRPCLISPRQYAGPYSQEEIPLSSYVSELFSSGQDVYLIWIEPGEDTYYYRIEELTSIAYVQTLFIGRDGGLYRLRPLPTSEP
jgi:hypothetical protein